MQSIMTSDPGKHQCPKCQGKGCYTCDRKGHYLMCPVCCNLDYQKEKTSDHFKCLACDAEYDKKGHLILGS
jgi:hypothetical protein